MAVYVHGNGMRTHFAAVGAKKYMLSSLASAERYRWVENKLPFKVLSNLYNCGACVVVTGVWCLYGVCVVLCLCGACSCVMLVWCCVMLCGACVTAHLRECNLGAGSNGTTITRRNTTVTETSDDKLGKKII